MSSPVAASAARTAATISSRRASSTVVASVARRSDLRRRALPSPSLPPSFSSSAAAYSSIGPLSPSPKAERRTTTTTGGSIRSPSRASVLRRPLSSSSKTGEEEEGKTKGAGAAKREGESFEETIRRLKNDDGGTASSSSDEPPRSSDSSSNPILSAVASAFDMAKSSINRAWTDLLNSERPSEINKKIHESKKDLSDDDEAADKYTGTTAIMEYDVEGNMTAWERMQKRLSEAPIIQGILDKSHDLYEKSGASTAKARIDDIREDAREAWETSQNPWVYRLSSVYDTLTAEHEFASAVRRLRVLDPTFTLEKWKSDVTAVTLPRIMELFLEGRIKELKDSLGESVYNRLAAEVRARKKEGVRIDSHVLGIMNSEILACETDDVDNKDSPIIVLHFMCQQINCVRRKSDDEIVEGSEDDIRANSYVVAFVREYDEKKGELNWKIVDFRFNGAVAYI